MSKKNSKKAAKSPAERAYLPETVYVQHSHHAGESSGDVDNGWLMTEESAEHASRNGGKYVGEYRLVRVVNIIKSESFTIEDVK